MFFKGQFISNKAAAWDFLSSLGMDDFDIEDFIQILISDEDIINWKEEAKEWEIDSMMQAEQRQALINDLEDIVNKLYEGKGTKKDIAKRIEYLCEYYW